MAWLIATSLSACANPVERQIQAYKESRLSSELSAYEAAHVQGRLLDACTKAGQIAAAYREAESPNFVAWDAKRKEDCAAALASIMPRADEDASVSGPRRSVNGGS